MIQIRFTPLAICLIFLQNTSFAASITNQNLQKQIDYIESSSTTQKHIEAIDDQTQLQREITRNLDHEIRLQTRYEQQLHKQLLQLKGVVDELDQEMDNIRQTKVNLYPLLERMTNTLQALVKADLPFDKQRRLERITQINSDLDNPQLSDAEKLERILIAYQTEIQYGTQVKSWFGRLSPIQEVQYLRVGRLGYYYLSLDASKAGVWHSKEQRWVILTNNETEQLRQAIIALNGGSAYPLLTLPKAL
ncbi:DUF3450 domain-containing protein [Vibrio splendidus]|uniref:DUF3450 domain-containing protein n=1 Tax=Vibrio splendidus TaxID=29497 RepID=UPI001BFFED04|nr:DUF3450 domain-containing protein [Vibrio splendidus]MBT9243196.1 DUF3450 domain-containing protein [Vibrio splendidus]MDP2615279.1 DUF3450 domain-containing protein [Vibrio splendidus]